MATYYLTGAFKSDEHDFVVDLDADALQDALVVAQHGLALNHFDVRHDELENARVLEVGREMPVDLDRCEVLRLEALKRYQEAKGAWQAQYESLRDELGHWRMLHAQGRCSRAQVTVFEDRVKAHEQAKP